MTLVRYLGAYANRSRALYRDADGGVVQGAVPDEEALPKSQASWARLLRMVFEVDPLTCLRCGGLRVVAVITEPALIRRLLAHVRGRASSESAGFDPRGLPA